MFAVYAAHQHPAALVAVPGADDGMRIRLHLWSLTLTGVYLILRSLRRLLSYLIVSASSSLETPSLIGFGAPSTRSLDSFSPNPVTSRTVLITCILFAPTSLEDHRELRLLSLPLLALLLLRSGGCSYGHRCRGADAELLLEGLFWSLSSRTVIFLITSISSSLCIFLTSDILASLFHLFLSCG